MRGKNVKGFWTEYRGQLLATLLFLLIGAGIPFDSYYHRELGAQELEILPGAKQTARVTDEEIPVFLCEGEGEFEGTAAKTEAVTLQAGNYLLQVVALPDEKGNFLEVYSERKMNPDNTQGALLAREELLGDSDVTEIPFTVEESLEDVSFSLVYSGEGLLNVSSFYLASTQPMYTDQLLLLGGIFLASLLILIWRLRGGSLGSEERTAFIVLLTAVILASLPLSYDSVLGGNDLYYQFNRIVGIQEGLKSGQFPVKIHSTLLHGYGYGSSIFYPELFLYLPAILGVAGLSPVNGYKLLLVCLNGATAWIAYRSFCGVTRSKKIGLMAALLYTLSIYRLVDVYSRAALGEALAMIFLPLVLRGMYELFLGDEKKWYLAALGFTGIMQSHVLSVELTACFAGIFGLCYLKRLRERGRLKALGLAAGTTALLNLGVILPLLWHTAYPYRVFSVESTLSWWTLTLPKLFDPLLFNTEERIYAGIGNGGEMPVSLGFVMLLGILAFLWGYFRREKKERGSLWKNCFFAFGLACFGIYLSTNLFPWDKVQTFAASHSALSFLYKLVTSIQLSWRFLGLSTALLSLVGAVGFYYLTENSEVRKVVFAGVCAISFFCAGVYVIRYCEEASPHYTFLNQYQREQGQVDVLYFPNVEHANSNRIWNRDNIFVPGEGAEVESCYRNGDLTAGFSYKKEEGAKAYVDAPLVYYPGYKAHTEEGEELAVEIGDQGTLRVWLPIGERGNVEISYREPWYVPLGRLISLITFLGLAAVLWKRRFLMRKNRG